MKRQEKLGKCNEELTPSKNSQGLDIKCLEERENGELLLVVAREKEMADPKS